MFSKNCKLIPLFYDVWAQILWDNFDFFLFSLKENEESLGALAKLTKWRTQII